MTRVLHLEANFLQCRYNGAGSPSHLLLLAVSLENTLTLQGTSSLSVEEEFNSNLSYELLEI